MRKSNFFSRKLLAVPYALFLILFVIIPLCLIIGYNEKTDEIAVSNSWGEHENTPSWISMTDAGIVHRGCLVIHP